MKILATILILAINFGAEQTPSSNPGPIVYIPAGYPTPLLKETEVKRSKVQYDRFDCAHTNPRKFEIRFHWREGSQKLGMFTLISCDTKENL